MDLPTFAARIAALLEREPVSESMTLAELGVDSLTAIDIILLMEEASGGTLDPESVELTERSTVAELYQLASRIS